MVLLLHTMFTQREMLERNAEYRGNNVALKVLETGEKYTYREFNDVVNQFANALRDRGIRDGDRVPLILYNTIEFPIALYGCYKAGAAPVPLNYLLATDNFTYIFDDINPSLVIYDEDVADAVETGLIEATASPHAVRTGSEPGNGESFDAVLKSGSDDDPPKIVKNPGRLSHLLYTSGTTGKPKGVTVTQESAYSRIQEAYAWMDINQDTVALQLSPWFHGGGMGTTVAPVLCAGGTLLVTTDWEPRTVAEVIDDHDVTYAVSVPTITQRLTELDDVDSFDFSSLNALLVQGAPLSEALAKRLIERVTPNIFNGYGSTETLCDLLLRPEDLPEHAGKAGRPSPAKEVRVIEYERGTDVSPDERAEIGEEGRVIVRGKGIMDSYFENVEATKATFEDGWFYHDDLAVMDEDGYITITGRADDMILSGGELVSPIEVEETLEQHESVQVAVVVGVPDEEWGQRVKAYVVGETDADELEVYCKDEDSIADYKRPKEYEFVQNIERTTTGKKQRYKYRPD